MRESTLIKLSLAVFFVGLVLLSIVEPRSNESISRNITISSCSKKEGNTYIFYTEEIEKKAIFRGDFPCKRNERITIKGDEKGEWFEIHSIKRIR